MFRRICLSLALLVATPAWSQGIGVNTADESQMMTPPPVNGQAYPAVVGSEERSNYLRAGLIFNTAYSNNVLGDVGINPVSDVSYSIFPTIAIDQSTSRLHWMMTYGPGFTFYQRTSSRNQEDQNVTLNFHYRVSPHITFSAEDFFQKSSSVFNQPGSFSGETVSGSPQPPLIAVIGPVASQLSNRANVQLTYQFGMNGMVGADGTFTNLDYLDPTEVSGLYDSSSSGGSAFYSYRFSRNHYIGGTYQYSRIVSFPVNAQSEIQAHTVFLFYTIYLSPTFSLSFSGGPQHYELIQPPVPTYGSWSPTFTASMGWQELHTNFSASYSRVVTGGGGLVGAFQSNSANASARWQLAHTWSLGASASYMINKSESPSSFLTTQGGHSIFGTVSVQHQLSQHLQLEFGYTHLHQSYSGIPVISNAPNTDREFMSISYQFARPLGR
jgi:hypothetical protein